MKPTDHLMTELLQLS